MVEWGKWGGKWGEFNITYIIGRKKYPLPTPPTLLVLSTHSQMPFIQYPISSQVETKV